MHAREKDRESERFCKKSKHHEQITKHQQKYVCLFELLSKHRASFIFVIFSFHIRWVSLLLPWLGTPKSHMDSYMLSCFMFSHSNILSTVDFFYSLSLKLKRILRAFQFYCRFFLPQNEKSSAIWANWYKPTVARECFAYSKNKS